MTLDHDSRKIAMMAGLACETPTPQLLPSRGRSATTRALYGLWAVMTLAGVLYVLLFARDFPVADEMVMVPVITGEDSITWDRLWAWHNEHRIPLPKSLFALTATWGGGLKGGMILNVLILSACSLVFMREQKRYAGCNTWSDLLFPALFLHLGMAENWLLSFQVHFVSSVLIMCMLWRFSARMAERLSVGTVLGVCLLSVLLPSCGGTTLVFVPPVMLVLVMLAARLLRGSWRQKLLAAVPLMTVLAVVAVCVAYFSGFRQTTNPPWSVVRFLVAAAEFTGTAWGPGAWVFTPYLGGATILLAIACALLALKRAYEAKGNERLAFASFALLITGSGILAGAIAAGRGLYGPEWSMTPRYASLMAPLVAGIYVVLSRQPQAIARHARNGLCIVAMALIIPNAISGVRIAKHHAAIDQRFEADVQRGVPIRALATIYAGDYLAGQPSLAGPHFRALNEHRIGPFARIPEPLPLRREPAQRLPLALPPKDAHGLTLDEAGWWVASGAEPYLEFELPGGREVLGVELVVQMEHNSADTQPANIRVNWLRTSEASGRRRFKHRYWLSMPLETGPQKWMFWTYDDVHTIRIYPDSQPFRLKLISAHALMGEASKGTAQSGPIASSQNR